MVLQVTPGDDDTLVTFDVFAIASETGDNASQVSRRWRDPTEAKMTGELLTLPRRHLICSPPSDMVTFSTSRGYDVKAGDTVKVMRGDPLHQRGIVRSVDLSRITLTLAPVMYSNESPDFPLRAEFEVPITNVKVVAKAALEILFQGRVGQEVMLVSGHEKGFRGTLRSVSLHSCEVGIGGLGIRREVPKEHVLDVSTGYLMNGQELSPALRKQFAQAYARSFVPQDVRLGSANLADIQGTSSGDSNRPPTPPPGDDVAHGVDST
ncbi:hypothetical protein BV22DRAFT_1135976, partial [Leucogyrophana mollusca]